MATTTATATLSTGRRVAQAAIVVMVLFVASRVLGLVREAAISHQFGTSPEAAAYQAAFRIPDFLFNLMAGGALASAFIPTFTGLVARDDRAGAWRLASSVANIILVSLGSIAALAALLAPWLVGFVVPGDAFTPEMRALTANLMRIMLVSTVIFSLSGLVMGILNALEHFVVPALAPLVYNASIIVGALVLAPRWGVYGLAFGVVLGALGHLLVQFPILQRHGMRYTTMLGVRDRELWPHVREVARLMAPRVVGVATVQISFLVNTILASYLYVEAIPALYYAFITMLLPQGIFALSVATAIFPTCAAQAARGEHIAMRRTLSMSLRAVLLLTLPATVGLIVLREPLIATLFQRGAFDSLSTAAAAWALLFYSLGLVGHSLLEIVNRAFYALHDTLTPVVVGVGAMLFSIALSLILMPRFGSPTDIARGPHGALALANSVATTLEMVLLLWLLRRRLNGLESRELINATVRLGAAALIMGAVLVGLMRVPALAALPVWLFTPLAIAAGGGVYVAAAWLLRAEELRLVPRLLKRKA
ncbi:MAG TPA: murein biosynthesis integral membrane protein MurJ [Ardenticatenaceae bacterium]|nr:murein biosynthesis integral membrane protein MurJ [Ardenticatenaceae bacterium]